LWDSKEWPLILDAVNPVISSKVNKITKAINVKDLNPSKFSSTAEIPAIGMVKAKSLL
jgi:hypothetical protein